MKDTFCVLPFIHSVYNPYDPDTTSCSILPCCRYDATFEIEKNEVHNPIKNSEVFKTLQEELSNGIPSKACWRCWKDESIGHQSYRQGMNETFSEIIESGEYADKSLRFLEITPSNVCNLACLSCSSSFSSKWVLVDNFIASDSKKKSIGFTDWRELDLSNLLQLKLMGGEPMFLKDNVELLKYLYNNNVLKNIDLTIITNLMNPLTEEWKNLFKECKGVDMYVSIDGIGSLNEYIRADSSWEKIEKNLFDVIDFANTIDMRVSVNTVISIYNVNKSLEIEEYFKSLNIENSQDVTTYPVHIDCKQLPDEVKKILIKNGVSKTVQDNLNTLSERKNSIADFFYHTEKLDKYHKRSFQKYNPEMYKILTEL
jgi:sulfatase maturation enzyme AslB (radical SAM superfamily)